MWAARMARIRSQLRSRLRSVVVAVVGVALAALGITAITQPAQALAPFDCNGSALYGTVGQYGRQFNEPVPIYGMDTRSVGSAEVPATQVAEFPIGNGFVATNGLAITPGGTAAWGIRASDVVYYDALTGETAVYPVDFVGSGGLAVYPVMGAFDPANNVYYFAQSVPGNNQINLRWTDVQIFGFDTVTKKLLTRSALVTFRITADYGGGDLAFDAAGDLFIVNSSSTAAVLRVLPGPIPTSGTMKAEPRVLNVLSVKQNIGGIAFDATGKLYLSNSDSLFRVDPANGQLLEGPTPLPESVTAGSGGKNTLTDLGSCSYPETLMVQKNIVSRVGANDQFTMAITGGDVTGNVSATTSGTNTGLQRAPSGAALAAGPIVAQPGTAYTITETPGNAQTNLDEYLVTWRCTDRANPSVPAITGTGTSFDLVAPNPPPGGEQPAIACVFTNRAAGPAIDVTKTVSPTVVTAAGQTVTYSYAVKNAGNVPLTGVEVADTTFTGTGGTPTISCPATTLDPGNSTVCTSTYTTTQEDVEAGRINNIAVASGIPPDETPVTSLEAEAQVIIPQVPGITLEKTATPSSIAAAGDTITYSFLVTNTGNVPLTRVSVNETEFSGTGGSPTITCQTTTLAVEESTTCTATYVATQTDVNAGEITNTASAVGTPPSGTVTRSLESEADVQVPAGPSITLQKSVSPTIVTAAGETVTYSFDVTNDGPIPLTDVQINETQFTGKGGPLNISCQSTDLAPGASTTCTAAYTTTQADVNTGAIENTAAATGTPPTGPDVVSPPAEALVSIPSVPAITLAKSATPTEVSAAGQQITYTFLVTNSGNAPLTGISVDDTQFSGAGAKPTISCPVTALELGESTTCTAVYTTVQDDIGTGRIENFAVATGNPPSGVPKVTSPPDGAEVLVETILGIDLVKTATPTSLVGTGDTVSYSFLVTNSGNMPLTGLRIEDVFSGSEGAPAVNCPVTTLDPAQSTICTSRYTTTQADLDAGSVENSATANATPPGIPEITSPRSDAIVFILPPASSPTPPTPTPPTPTPPAAPPAPPAPLGALASTGSNLWTPILVAGAVLLAAGALLLLTRRRRAHTHKTIR